MAERLINADALPRHGKRKGLIYSADVDKAPTVDAVPVRHGKWVHRPGSWFHNDYQCSECGNYLDFNGLNAGRGNANFCPNCGADMRGEQNG